MEGAEPLQPVRRAGTKRLLAVYASKHLSYYDKRVLFAKLLFQFRILAKAPL